MGDLVDKSFALTFTSKLNQSYTTKPIIVQNIAGASPATVAGAELTTSMAVQSALHELPNYVVDSCGVTCTYEYAVGVDDVYPSVKCAIKFTGGSVAGPQYLLEVEADKCDSGCTPQLSSPVQLKSAVVASTASTAFLAKSGTESTTDGDVTDAATAFDVAAGDGALFAADDLIQIGGEILKVTAVSGDELTVTRAQESTTAEASTDGDAIYLLESKTGAHPDVLSSVAETQTADYNSFECGRRGKCDYSSECECFEGYMGDRCQTQTALI